MTPTKLPIPVLGTIVSNAIVNIIYVADQSDTYDVAKTPIPINDKHYEITTSFRNSDRENYLSAKTIQKMIYRLLTEKKISRKKLADLLEITVKKLEMLLFGEEVSLELIPKINLPLIKLYCETNFYQSFGREG
jgi:hypothetical protein